MRRAIRGQLPVFVVMLAVIAVGTAVGAYILSNQRLYLPASVPVLGTDFYEIQAEMTTTQGVVPGQGQTVQIAGVTVGEVGSVTLEDGTAVVDLRIYQEYGPVYRDASALLRPRTGLKDMYVALDRGTQAAGELPEGGRVGIGDTLPDINPDEVLAELDADTRPYLKVLLDGGGQAFADTGQQPTPAQSLRETFKRFEPTARFGKRFTALLSERRRNLRRAIHNFQQLSTELARKDRQLARLVGSANATLEPIAAGEAELREALELFPGALSQTESALQKVDILAGELGPALEGLRPFARELRPALRSLRPFLDESTPIVRDQVRPFARDVQPVVRDVRTASQDLAVVTPRLTKSTKVLNSLFNLVAHDPPGEADSSLFWGAWAVHSGASAFSTQDAHGVAPRGLLLLSCTSYNILDALALGDQFLNTNLRLLNLPPETEACPQNGQDPAGAGGAGP